MISRLSIYYSILLLGLGLFQNCSSFVPPPRNPHCITTTKNLPQTGRRRKRIHYQNFPKFILWNEKNNDADDDDDDCSSNDSGSFSESNVIKRKVVELQSKLQAAGRAGLC